MGPSAIIYCLRCLIDQDIPLNQGCLKPVDVRIPSGSLLSPSEKAAVVGGNVLTSQRVTDVVFKCFEAHMTNTRITDAEVFERRYPVILREFSLRAGTGGVGQHKGGDGVIRDIEFRIPVQVSILSERRVYRPYGMHGGGDAQCGKNIWVRKMKKAKSKGTGGEHEGKRRDDEDKDEYEERFISMGAKNTASMQPGERIIVMTPGGGGYGKPGDKSQVELRQDYEKNWKKGSLASRLAEWESSS